MAAQTEPASAMGRPVGGGGGGGGAQGLALSGVLHSPSSGSPAASPMSSMYARSVSAPRPPPGNPPPMSDKVSRRRQEMFVAPLPQGGAVSAGAPLARVGEDELLSEGCSSEFTHDSCASWPGLASVLSQNVLFRGTSAEQIALVAASMKRVAPPAGTVLMVEGEAGDRLYVVQQGSLHVTCTGLGELAIDVVGANRVVGELAVLFESPRAATVTVASLHAVLWQLTRAQLQRVESDFMLANLERRAAQLQRIPEFERLDAPRLRRVAAVMQEEAFAVGDVICREGERLVQGVNDKFYTISRGQVEVSILCAPTATAAAAGQQPPSVENSSGNVGPCAAAVRPCAHAGSEGAPGMTINCSSRVVATLSGGQWFGEMALMSDHPRSATVIASQPTLCLTLSRGAFAQIVSQGSDPLVLRRIASKSELRKEDNHETLSRQMRAETAARLGGLLSLRVRHVIGEGAFSVVRLATLREDRKLPALDVAFALKTMNKQDLTERKQVVHVNNERKILSQSSHPFILSLVKTFSTPHHIYMLFELVQGGELFSLVVGSNGGLPRASVRFYLACIVEGLSYLHRKRIAYRDLKLENLVISADGYVKIIDFGFAKQLSEEGETTRTLCGTPDYLAPEAVTRHGHSYMVDNWSVGVLCFEMLTQFSPYADTSGQNNHMVVFRRIVEGWQSVDWTQLQRAFRGADHEFALVKAMLVRLWDINPHTRLTCAELKEPHPYFEGLSFLQLREKQLAPPWTPAIASYMDTSHFDVAAFTSVRESSRLFCGDQTDFADF
jgi:serine/threonine protein kinase